MKILVVGSRHYARVGDGYYAQGTTSYQYNTLSVVFDQFHVLSHVQRAATPPNGAEKLGDHIHFHPIARRQYSRAFLPHVLALITARQTAAIVRQHDIDLVIGKIPGHVGVGAMVGARLAGCPGIILLIGDWLRDEVMQRPISRAFRSALMRLAIRNASAITPVSAWLGDRLVEAGLPGEKITGAIAPPAVTEKNFAVPPLVAGTTPKTVLFLGRLVESKNLDRLLEAWRILLDRSAQPESFRLQIVGDGNLRPHLEQLAARLRLGEYVEFVGPVPRSEVVDYLQHAWALVLPSTSEGFGKVIAEAMAAGRPVVASRVGPIPELVDENTTGYLFDPYDVQDIAAKLKLLLSDEAQAMAMGRAAQDRAKAWTEAVYQRRMRELAERVVAARQ